MKTNFYILALAFVCLQVAKAQTAPATGDYVALPSPYCVGGSPFFPAPANYNPLPASTVQLGVNNTGTDVCQLFGTSKIIQVMTWDNVTSMVSQTNFISNVYISWNISDSPVGSFMFPIPGGEKGGFDPDVAVISDASGTFLEVVFENNSTGKIDGYSFQWNGSTFVPYSALPLKSTLCHDATKKAKNPNIAGTKNGSRIAVVWHEEGLVNPPQQLTITYSTTPPISYTSSIALLESKVYIYSIDKPGYLGDLLGSSSTPPLRNFAGVEVIRTAPSNNYHLFDRNFNPDVSFSEEAFNANVSPTQNVISVVFLSQWFDPSTFSIVTGQMAVVQGTTDHFASTTNANVLTATRNFTTSYSGKPRIAARLPLSGSYNARDFGVVMGNSTTVLPPCGGASQQASKLHFWWSQNLGTTCPDAGVDLIQSTAYASVTTTDPVISCVNAKGYYDVAFSTNVNGTNAFDVVASTFRDGGVLVNAGAFSRVNYGSCTMTAAGNQVIPSVASVRLTSTPDVNNANTNYLFWDQNNKTLDYKKVSTNLMPGGGQALRQTQEPMGSRFMVYPNPAESEILFDLQLQEDETAGEIEVFNLVGQSVGKLPVKDQSATQKMELSRMPSGTYIAILKTNVRNYKVEFVKK